ncbi:MAG: hypothetical protein ACYC6L_18300 [Anaerolineae bacterium]
MVSSEQAITALLLDIKRQANVEELFPALYPEASELLHSNPYAFISSACLDRGTKTEIIWTIPYWLQQETGHYDARQFYRLTLPELTELFVRLPRKPHYINAAPRTFSELTRIVVEECDADASRIWVGRRASEVRRLLLSIFGVGPGIANMTVLLIERGFGVCFSDLDRRRMDIKPDVHTMRVLYRLGVAAVIREDEAIMAARDLNPAFPGDIDEPLWLVGRKWCSVSSPNCPACPLQDACAMVGLSIR